MWILDISFYYLMPISNCWKDKAANLLAYEYDLDLEIVLFSTVLLLENCLLSKRKYGNIT